MGLLDSLFGAQSLPSSPTSQATSTGTSTGTISPWAQPYVNNYLNQAQNLVNTQQTPALLGQSYTGAANLQLPSGFAQGSALALAGGQGSLANVPIALGYGQQGAAYGAQGPQYGAAGANYGAAGAQYGSQGTEYGNLGTAYGAQGANLGVTGGAQYGGQAAGYGQLATQAGQNYANQATSPQAMQAYMSPYMTDVVDWQKQQAIRDYQIQAPQMAAQAVGSGAFGGNRLALQQSEANRGLQNRLAGIEATGQQQAYQNAQQAQQYGANLGLQGLQAGIQGSQAGLQGVGTQLAGTAQGMQGAGVGLAGLGTAIQGTQAGMQGQQVGLAGLGTAMQGSQVGLQGVAGAQAGYGGATQAGGTLGNIAAQQSQAELAQLAMKNQFGLQQQNWPYQQLQTLQGLMGGLPVTSQTTTGTQQGYTAPPNYLSQGAGAATSILGGLGLYNALNKAAGGQIKSYASGGLVTLALDRAMRGAA